jgi:hypothetical protein
MVAIALDNDIYATDKHAIVSIEIGGGSERDSVRAFSLRFVPDSPFTSSSDITKIPFSFDGEVVFFDRLRYTLSGTYESSEFHAVIMTPGGTEKKVVWDRNGNVVEK